MWICGGGGPWSRKFIYEMADLINPIQRNVCIQCLYCFFTDPMKLYHTKHNFSTNVAYDSTLTLYKNCIHNFFVSHSILITVIYVAFILCPPPSVIIITWAITIRSKCEWYTMIEVWRKIMRPTTQKPSLIDRLDNVFFNKFWYNVYCNGISLSTKLLIQLHPNEITRWISVIRIP